ncbi:MAG: diacylglycerol kinase family protein [Candidatus Paceibacterota bacterium]
MDTQKEKRAWSFVRRAQSFTHALRGIRLMFLTTPNAWIHISATVIVVMAGCYFSISLFEWMAIIVAIGLVFIAEAFNTAIEIDINLTSPEFHPYARDTKDVAAGAVLIAALISAIVGLIVFLPKIFNMIQFGYE